MRLDGLIWEYQAVTDSKGDSWAAKIFRGRITETPNLPEPMKVTGFGWFTKDEIVKLHQAELLVDYAVKDLKHLGWL